MSVIANATAINQLRDRVNVRCEAVQRAQGEAIAALFRKQAEAMIERFSKSPAAAYAAAADAIDAASLPPPPEKWRWPDFAADEPPKAQRAASDEEKKDTESPLAGSERSFVVVSMASALATTLERIASIYPHFELRRGGASPAFVANLPVTDPAENAHVCLDFLLDGGFDEVNAELGERALRLVRVSPDAVRLMARRKLSVRDEGNNILALAYDE
jgi:hypothetical protein